MSRNHRQGIVKQARALLMAAVFALLHLGSAAAQNKASSLLVMGDSLSAAYGLKVEQGWVSLLAKKLEKEGGRWQVVNASISGETTAGGASRIANELKQHRPGLVVIELGANDGLRGLPLEIAESNLDKMIQASKTAGADVLLVGMHIPPNYGPDYTQAFHGMYAELAKRHGVTLLPFLMAPIAADRGNYLEDNLHPTAAAQPALLAHVWTALAPMLK
jgi:acyl-CoA thioesterase-1